MNIPTIHFSDGHECRHNGVGDFNLHCPDGGLREGFIPYFTAAFLPGLRCNRCSGKIGEALPEKVPEQAA